MQLKFIETYAMVCDFFDKNPQSFVAKLQKIFVSLKIVYIFAKKLFL